MIIHLKIEATIPPMKGHSIISSPAIKKNVSIIVLLEDYVVPFIDFVADSFVVVAYYVRYIKICAL